MSLPGDELVPAPRLSTTHAVTINTAADAIWPWLLQIGQGRGGFYSYDWLENLFRLDIHTIEEIQPDLQDLQAGDVIPFAPDGSGMTVARLDPAHALVLYGGAAATESVAIEHDEGRGAPSFRTSWAFVLHEMKVNSTRLVVRLRATWARSPVADVGAHVLLEPAHFIMERKMLLRIKSLAEQRERDQALGGCREIE